VQWSRRAGSRTVTFMNHVPCATSQPGSGGAGGGRGLAHTHGESPAQVPHSHHVRYNGLRHPCPLRVCRRHKGGIADRGWGSGSTGRTL